MGKVTNIGSRIHSVERGNVVAGANEILDDAKGKKQNVINNEVDAKLVRLDQSKQNNLTFDNTPMENSNNPVKSGGVYAADKALSEAIEAILILIPSAATALNQLADKNFVNSSIATDTATFRGTSATGLSEAQFLEWANSLTHDMNDYVFWQTIDEAGNTLFKRYKWNGTQWLYEYTLNNSSFTADQWAAITSGITTALVEKLVGLPTNTALQQALNGKQNALTFDNVPTEDSTNPVKSGGIYSVVKAEEDARLNLAQTVSEIGGDVSQIEDVIPAGATAQNKLVANASMEAYVASIIQNITASFTLATTDGHINLTLTQVNGQVATLTLASSDIASAQALTALTGRVTTAEGNITSLTGRVSTNETDIANLQQLYNDLQQSKPVPVTALPETGQQQGVIYRLAGTTSYSDYMWNGSTWVLMATYNNAIDPRPKKASQNLVTSGGVFDNMGALDVSELNATENPHTLAQYADLPAALAAIPTDYQKGGMSIKFVQSSDNTYVQFRLMKSQWSTEPSDWQEIYDIIESGNDGNESMSFVDEAGNCAMQVKNGHIKTKNFDSRESVTEEDVPSITGIVSDNEEVDDEELALVDEESNAIALFKDGHIKTKHFDSRNIKFNSFESIGIDRLTIGGSSSRNVDGSIALASGDSNRCYIDAQLQCWHYTLSAKFRCSSTISFIIGKKHNSYGGYVKIYKDGNGSYLDIYSGEHLGHHGVLDFEMNFNEDYLIRIQNDVDNTGKTWVVELIGNLDEYYTATYIDSSYAMHAYGTPYVSTETGAIVKSFDFSIQRWYDTKEARCGIFGHSYVEGDSLGNNRDKCFANLLAQYFGEKKMINFGLGGLELEELKEVLSYSLQFAKAGEYCIVMIGGNDARKSGVTSSYMIQKLQECIALIVRFGLTPILCTEASGPAEGVLTNTLEYNTWIRNSGYLYCDTAQVFFDVDITTTTPTNANIRDDLFLGDNVHPTVQGHKLLFERFKKDCPYLF